jgi:hypothetical protein
MRTTTTIRLPDGLLKQAKKRAREEGRSLTAFIEDGIREAISRRSPRGKRVRPLISSVHGSVCEGIDLANSAEIEAVLDDDVIREAGLVKLR